MRSTLAKACLSIGSILAVTTVSLAQAEKDIYRDKNGYFAAVRPQEWRQQDYPEETVRSKVAFHHPQIKGVTIRIISGPTPTPSYSLDDLLEENQNKIATFFKPKFPSGTFTVTREKISDRDAVVQRNSAPGLGEQEVVLYVNKNIWYSIALGANSKGDLDRASTDFQSFLNSFTILDPGKKFSDKEIRSGLVAKYKRVAKLWEEQGRKADALEFVNQGLAIDPNDAELKQMKIRLLGKVR